MKLWSLLAAFFTVVVIPAPAAAAEDIFFHQLWLQPPLNWLYGEKLGDRILEVFDAEYEKYNISDWVIVAEQKCIDWLFCNTTMIYSVGDGTPHKSWIGVVFQGPHAFQPEFYRQDGITDSTVLLKYRMDAV
ncbi:hypothetical protein ACJ73_09658 [Blastomyces percursus]|uniref:Uncharacterized protein n=1 Tax=Blastomyces percursus TaxID=1658174 RepID=A0A1J9PSV2_9EURO|nr:hypothetical protein ACJ73_09658 [Blastomyces percursus]